MDLNLFRDIKLKGYFLKLVAVVMASIILTVILVLIVGKNRLDDVENIIPFAINFALLIITLIELKKNGISIKTVIGRPKKKSFIFEVPIALILTYVAGMGLILILLYIVYKVNPYILQSFNKSLAEEHQKARSIFIITIDFVDTVVLAPILEEIIFRGILLSKLYSKYGIVRAIIFTSVIFFMVHFKTNPMTFIIGITNCILVLKYKSLIPAILVHALNNLFVLTRIMGSKANVQDSAPLEVNIVFLIAGIIMVGIYALYIYKSSSNIKKVQMYSSNNLIQ